METPGNLQAAEPALRRETLSRTSAARAEGPGLPFWLVSFLFLGLPVTLGGLLLALWVALFS
ncbi:MAG: hypothetical protein IT285_15440 [Bdellovibrionales bacterium]|nr:hypothetical protein [Bdellovibrionales bacterium]